MDTNRNRKIKHDPANDLATKILTDLGYVYDPNRFGYSEVYGGSWQYSSGPLGELLPVQHDPEMVQFTLWSAGVRARVQRSPLGLILYVKLLD